MKTTNSIALLGLCTLHGSLFSTSRTAWLAAFARAAKAHNNPFLKPPTIRMSFLYPEEKQEKAESTALVLVLTKSKALVPIQPAAQETTQPAHTKLELSHPRLCCLFSKLSE